MTSLKRGCVRGRLLREYLRGTLRPELKEKTDAHLALCRSCRNIVEGSAQAIALRVTADDLRMRVARAADVVRDVIEPEAPHRLHTLVSSADWGEDRFVAGRLLERSREEFDSQPRKALDFARAAIEVAERAGSADLQFEAWRDCVSICVRLGHLSAAWDAVERVEAIAPRTAHREHARGQLFYARAYVGSQPDVWKIDESLVWAEEASRIFAGIDDERHRATAELRAHVYYCRGEYAAAVEISRKLWEARREKGQALSFVAHLVAYGQPAAAEDVLAWARPQVAAEDVVTTTRIAFAEGRIFAAQKRWEEAAEALRRASLGFRRAGMEDTAIRVDLGRIRAEVSGSPDSISVQTRAMRDLRTIVAISAELDRREPTRRRRFTVEALDYLRELAEASALTVDLLCHVEEYLDAITRGPARRFVPPVPTRAM